MTLAQAMEQGRVRPGAIGPDPERLARIGAFVELHIEQGRALDVQDDAVGVASAIWPHGRWRFDFRGEANHAGTTRLEDRHDPMLTYANTVLAARKKARLAGALATFGKVAVEPNGVNAIASLVRGWLDSRAADEDTLAEVVAAIEQAARERGARDGVSVDVVRESFTPVVEFAHDLRDRLAALVGGAAPVPVLPTGAGHDAGILVRGRADRHAVRTQPDRRLALPGGNRGRGRLRGRGRRARRRTGGSRVQVTYWLEHAWLDPNVEPGVVLTAADGRITAVAHRRAGAPPPGATVLRGLTLPGLANAHSHAFHRALRGTVQVGSGTFWTWREVMYATARSLTPDSYFALARAVYAEMALAGITCVGEFHYLHHQPDGTPYDDPNAMGEALIAAAAEAGIRITLLDTAYLHGGLVRGGFRPLEGAQLRFGDGTADAVVRALVPAQGHRARQDRRGPALGTGLLRPRRLRGLRRAHPGRAHPPAPVRAARGERGVPGRARPHPHPAARRLRLLGPEHHRRARHPPDRRATSPTLGAARTTVCMCPTTERDLADGIGPAPRLRRAGSPPEPGQRQPRRHRPVRGGARDGAERAAAHPDPRPLDRRPTAARRHRATATPASAGPRPAGLEPGALADFTTIALDSVRTAGPPPRLGAETAVFAATGGGCAAHRGGRAADRPGRAAPARPDVPARCPRDARPRPLRPDARTRGSTCAPRTPVPPATPRRRSGP